MVTGDRDVISQQATDQRDRYRSQTLGDSAKGDGFYTELGRDGRGVVRPKGRPHDPLAS